MIYLQFILSLLAFLILNLWQRYIEYFPSERTNVYRPAQSFIRSTLLRNFFKPAKSDDMSSASKIRIALIKGFKKFLISFCVVAFFFSILQFWLQKTAYSDLSQATVLMIEQRIYEIQQMFEPLDKYKFLPEVALIALLIALGSLWPIVEKLKLKKGFEHLMKAVGLVTGIITIAASFSFFRNEIKAGENHTVARLRVHNATLIKSNKDFATQLEQEVKEEIVEKLLDNKTINEFITSEESANSAVDSLLATQDYEFYITYITNQDPVVRELTSSFKPGGGGFNDGVNNYESDFVKRNTDFINAHADIDVAPLERKAVYSAADFHNAISYQRYKVYTAAGIINESRLSEQNLEQAVNILNEITSNAPPLSASRYGEVGMKIFDNTYSLTIKGWVNDGLSTLINIPLLGEIFEPIHDMFKDYLAKKVEKVMVAIYNKDPQKAESEFRNIGPELDERIAEISNSKNLRARFRERLELVRSKIISCAQRIKLVNSSVTREAEQHLAMMKNRCRWQRIRDNFAIKAAAEVAAFEPSEPFTREQWREYDAVLNEWERYANDNKVKWLKNRKTELEPLFYEYIKQNPRACGAWGFILQQSDWDGAVNYYTLIAPDATATGKPYYLLKYYCNTTGYGDVDQLYTVNVDKVVGELCPH